jgi:hypothetical protein
MGEIKAKEEKAVKRDSSNKKATEGSRYFCESLFWASQPPKQAAKT